MKLLRKLFCHQDFQNNYPDLDLQAKLQLLNAGLNALEINTFEKKEKLVEN